MLLTVRAEKVDESIFSNFVLTSAIYASECSHYALSEIDMVYKDLSHRS